MKTMLVVTVSVLIGGVAAGGDRPVLRGREAPRATDLLRAEKLAQQAEQRRKLPARRGPGWLRGGSGWGEDARGPREGSPPVVINVTPPSKRSRAD